MKLCAGLKGDILCKIRRKCRRYLKPFREGDSVFEVPPFVRDEAGLDHCSEFDVDVVISKASDKARRAREHNARTKYKKCDSSSGSSGK